MYTLFFETEASNYPKRSQNFEVTTVDTSRTAKSFQQEYHTAVHRNDHLR